MKSTTIAKACASATLTCTVPVPFDLLGELKAEREAHGISQADLAARMGCTEFEIHAVECGYGRFEILVRMMDALHVDLTKIASGTFLHLRLKKTREETRRWTVARLAEKSGLPIHVIENLEHGFGLVRDFLDVLRILAPKYNRRGGKGGKGEDKDSCFTHPLTVTALKTSFGRITFDPCAHSLSPVKPANGCYFELGQDGLATPWEGRFVFMNPPFSRLTAWTTYALEQWRGGKIKLLACLVPTRTDTRFFFEALISGAAVFFFGNRLKFTKPDGTIEASKITTMLVVFGSSARQRAEFGKQQEGVWVKLAAGPGGETTLREAREATSSEDMRREQNSRTSCPNSSVSAHAEEEASAGPDKAPCPIMQELEAEFRNPHGLRKRAEYYGRRCQTDPDDLLSAAIERALRRPEWDQGVRERIESILSSIASTINRARARAKLRGTDLMSLDDGTIVDRQFPCLHDPAEAAEMESRRRGSEKALDMIARGEPKLRALINGIGLGLRGKHLQINMGVTELQLATLRRRLKRSAEVVCAPLCLGDCIEADRLEGLAA